MARYCFHQKYFFYVCIFIHAYMHETRTFAVPLCSPYSESCGSIRSSYHSNMETWIRTVALSTTSNIDMQSNVSGTLHAMRSGPLAAVYRATLSTDPSERCTAAKKDTKCEVAVDGFANVGEVQYTFNNSEKNLKGQSTQVLVACRCLSEDCRRAILVRPVSVTTKDADGRILLSGRTVCLYEAVKGKFSECHKEMFRVSYRGRDYRLKLDLNNPKATEYSVSDEHHADYWTARGHRGSRRECLDNEIRQLPLANISSMMIAQGVNSKVRSTAAESSACVPPTGVTYFRSDEKSDSYICGELFDRALTAASSIASQQDCFGVGKREIAFMNKNSASLISDTELALVCSSAVLGILLLWSVIWKQLRQKKQVSRFVAIAVFVQVLLSYILEALPMHTALNTEILARAWRSVIAFTDVTLAYRVEEKIVDNVLIFTVIIGEAQYMNTRVGLVAGLTVFFDFVATILVLVILRWVLGCSRQDGQGNILMEGSEEIDTVTTTSSDNYWR